MDHWKFWFCFLGKNSTFHSKSSKNLAGPKPNISVSTGARSPKHTLLQSNGEDLYPSSGKFRFKCKLHVKLFHFCHLPFACLPLQVIRVGQTQFLPPLFTAQSFVENTELLQWGGVGLHLLLSACLTSQCMFCRILFAININNIHININNRWHSTTNSPRGRSACKYPLAL